MLVIVHFLIENLLFNYLNQMNITQDYNVIECGVPNNLAYFSNVIVKVTRVHKLNFECVLYRTFKS